VGPLVTKIFTRNKIAAVGTGQKLKVIPRNLIELSNGDIQKSLQGWLKRLDLPRHDAIMPTKLAEFFIRFLTDPGDLVADPFHGSGTTALAAERLGRSGVGSDRSIAHLFRQRVAA
jgi:DNA modification methylase